jgi:hypothetical protein
VLPVLNGNIESPPAASLEGTGDEFDEA